METLEGVLHFFTETGTEGGDWAFQDSQFIYTNTTHYACTKCNQYWNKEKDSEIPVSKEKDRFQKFCSPEYHDFELCGEMNWRYEGLHILKNGDQLTIYNPEGNSEV
jgi:hypothetical protein